MQAKEAGVRVGDVLAGKYRVEGVLGAGGMGVVVAAHHLQLDERVALKFLLPEAAADQEAMARFDREARAAVKIKSEHVARVIDVGTLENGAPYIVMEFLDGADLGAWLSKKGPLRIEQAVEFLLQACEAIAEAHSLGIVHRDLKPANLFVVRRNDGVESNKVLDFGISKFTGHGDISATRTSVVMGTPHYMSPEQMRSSRDVTPQSDIWALGVILYELLAGKPPFLADTFPEVCIKVATEPPPPIDQLRPEVPPQLRAVISKCLEKDNRKRYQDVAELAVALQDFAPRRALASIERIFGILSRTRASAAPPAPLPGSTLQAGTMAPFGRTSGYTDSFLARERRRSKSRWVAVGAVLATGAVVLAGVATMSGHATHGAGTAAQTGGATSAAPSAENGATKLVGVPSAATVPPPAVLPPAPSPDSAASVPVDALPEAPAAPGQSGHRHVVRTPSGPSHGAAPSSDRPPGAQALRPTAGPATPSEPTTTTSPRTAPSVDCDPPFYFDANGTRIFKRECVQ
jgi:serine/threonine-protein kinase